MDAPDLTGPGRDQINRSLPTSSSPAQGPTPGSQNTSSVVGTINSGVSSGGLVPSSSSVVVGVSSGAGGTASSVTMSNSGPGPGGGPPGVGVLPGGISTAFSNHPNGSLNLQPSSVNPSKRLKVSDSTESHGDFWDLASELPDELTFGNLDGGLLGPPSSTINTVNTSINSSLSLPNTSVSGMVMGNNNNTMVTSNAGHLGMASNVQFTQQQQMQIAPQQPQQGHQQLSQILSNRTQGINIQMPQQPGQRLPQTQLQAQLQARPTVSGPQMRYTGPVNPQQPQQRMQMIQQPPQNQSQYQVTQQQSQQQSNFVGQINSNIRTPQNQVRFPQGNQSMMQPPQAAPVNQGALIQQSPMNGGQMMNQMASSLGCPVAGGSGNGSADPEKRKLIQQQLVLLLHAHKCQRREQQGGPGSCTLPHCRTMKQVLNHMTGCTAGKQCTVPHCASSRQIISHWKNCTRADCPVCLPLKQASDRRNQQNHQIGSFSGNVNNAPTNSSNSFINSLMPPSSQGHAAAGTQSPQIPQPPMNMQTSTGPPAGNQPPSMQGAYQMLGLSYNSGSPSPRNQSIAGGQIRPSLQGGPSVTVQQVPSQGPPVTGPTPIVTNGQGAPAKDWHSTVTQDLRNHLIQKIVQAIFPASDPNAYRDNRMKNLFAYAEKVERDMYDTANSREEYYHLLAEKIYKIQKELEEKRQKRREQQQLQQQGQIQNQPITAGGSQPQLQNQTPLSAGQQAVGIRPTVQQNQMSSTAIGGRMNLNMPAPPNVTIQGNHMPPHSGQQSQYFVQPPTPGQQQGQVRSGTSSSSPAFANVTLQGMLAGHPSQSPSTLFSGIQNQQSGQVLQQPNTPQAPSSVMSMASNATPPPPRPSSVPGAGNQLQAQLINQSGQGTLASAVQMKQENGPPTVSIPGLDSDMTLEKMLTKTEPKDPLDEFIMGTSCNVTTATSLSSVVSEGKASLEAGIKKDEPEEQMEGIDDSSQGGKGKEEGPKSSTGVTSSSAITSSSTPSASKSSPSSDNVSSSDCKSSVSSTPSSCSAFASASSSPAVRPKKVFKPNEIRQALMPTLEKLLRQDPESLPFRQPVDPVLLNIPDYFDIIKKPMDLSTIKKRLDHGEYQDPWQYINDVYLMFDNARLYNRKTSKVYRYCTKLNEIFEQEIDPVMQNLGYCCGRRHVFQPQVLCCFGKQLCTIPRDAKYMSYENKITYCMKCFSEITTDYVSVDSFGLDPSLTGTTTVAKDQFKELKNDHLDYEPFVECKECGRSLHQVCVVHLDCIWSEGFTCEGCLRGKGKKRKENRYSAKRLPPSRLGTYIENRVNSFLRKKDSGAGEVTIRVVSSSEKTVEVKPGMKARYEGDWPDTFPYKAKALFAFEDFNGVDVCFFGMHVQEYASDAPPPNSRRVYIAYLDSVHFFRPKQYRTAVYHEILLGYLEYAKKQGYTMAHIWACPPSEGDDYIFHCHPPEQKIPKPKRLQDWYKKMLDIGIQEKIVVSYQDILKQAQQDGVQSAKDLPYFEGDFWPNVIEDSIKEIEMEQQKQQQQQNESGGNGNSNHATDDDSMDTTSESGESKGTDAKNGDSANGPNQKNQKKSGANKKSNKKQNQRKNNQTRNKSGGQVAGQPQLNQAQQWEQELTSRIYGTMEKHKEVFFVIRLHSLQAAGSLGEINDPDQLINCDLMDGRDAFLTLAREKHYEFSSLRRAKFSSVALLWELHNSTNGGFVYTCNRCKRHVVETRWHCTECDDFDLCGPCYRVENHPHRMEKSGDFFGAGDADVGAGAAGAAGGEYGPAGSAVTSPGEARKESIKRCIQSLVHACQCKDANCRLPSCHKMKCVVRHAKQCKRKGTTQGSPGNNCPICKQLIALCCYHAKHCNEAKCTVPYCVNIKAKLKQQQLQQRFQQQAILRRRIANMNSMTAAINASSSDNGSNTSNFPAHSGMKPVTVTPPPGALQAVQQVQAAVRQQQQGSHSIGKGGKGITSGKGSGGKAMASPGGPPTPASVGGGKGNIYGKGNPHGYPSPASTPTTNSMMGQMRSITPQSQGGMDPMQMQQQNQQRLMLQQQQQAMSHQPPPQYMQQGQMQWQPQQPQTSQPQMPGPGQRMRMPSPGAGKGQQQMLQQQLMSNQGVGGPTMVSHNQSPQGQPSMMSQPLQQQMMPQQGQIAQSGLPPQSQGQGMASSTGVQNLVGNVRGNLGASQLAMSSPVMQQLLATLRSPHSPQQQQEVLQILKSNPQVMAAFIKQRQQQQQQWQRSPQMQNAPQMPAGQPVQPGQQQQQWQRAPQMQTPPQMQPGQQLQPNQQQQQQWQRPPQMQPGQQQQQWQRAPQMPTAPQMQPGQQLPPVHQQQAVRAQLMRSPPQMSSPRYAMGLGQTVASGSPDDMMPFTGDSFANQLSQPQNAQQQQQMNPSDQLSSLVDNL